MERSESIKEIAAALVKAQQTMESVAKDETAKVKTKQGYEYTYSYATLDGVLDAAKPPLNANGIAICQDASAEGTKVTVRTLLLHVSGEFIGATLSLTASDQGPQSIGSAISYARRYGLASLLGISYDQDDDARTADGGRVVSQAALPAANGKASAAKAKVAAAAQQLGGEVQQTLQRAQKSGGGALPWDIEGTPKGTPFVDCPITVLRNLQMSLGRTIAKNDPKNAKFLEKNRRDLAEVEALLKSHAATQQADPGDEELSPFAG